MEKVSCILVIIDNACFSRKKTQYFLLLMLRYWRIDFKDMEMSVLFTIPLQMTNVQ